MRTVGSQPTAAPLPCWKCEAETPQMSDNVHNNWTLGSIFWKFSVVMRSNMREKFGNHWSLFTYIKPRFYSLVSYRTASFKHDLREREEKNNECVIVPSTSGNVLPNASLSPAHFKPNWRPWIYPWLNLENNSISYFWPSEFTVG